MRFARKPKLVRKLSSFSDRTDPLAPGNRKGSLPSIRGGRGAGGRGGDRATSAPQDGPDLSVGAAAAAATAPPQAADGSRAPRRPGARPEDPNPRPSRSPNPRLAAALTLTLPLTRCATRGRQGRREARGQTGTDAVGGRRRGREARPCEA